METAWHLQSAKERKYYACTGISTLLMSRYTLSFQSPFVNKEGDSSSVLLMICNQSS